MNRTNNCRLNCPVSRQRWAKCNSEDQQSDETNPDLQSLFERDVDMKVCAARKRLQGIEQSENVPSSASVVQIQTVATTLGPRDIERLSQSLPPARTQFTEFSRALVSKMRLYNMS